MARSRRARCSSKPSQGRSSNVVSSELALPFVHAQTSIGLSEQSLSAFDSRAWGLGERDRRILTLAQRKLGSSTDFGEALRALAEATRELIPAGRTYLLGQLGDGPLVGSVISGVGLFVEANALMVGRVDRQGCARSLGSFSH